MVFAQRRSCCRQGYFRTASQLLYTPTEILCCPSCPFVSGPLLTQICACSPLRGLCGTQRTQIEAVLLNSKDLDFLGVAHVARSALWTLYLRHTARTRPTLHRMWMGMCTMQYLCVVIWAGRILTSGKKLGIPLYDRTMRWKKVCSLSASNAIFHQRNHTCGRKCHARNGNFLEQQLRTLAHRLRSTQNARRRMKLQSKVIELLVWAVQSREIAVDTFHT
jgi:hypothetical protein